MTEKLNYSFEHPEDPDPQFTELFAEIKQLEPSAVVFNFECCDGCSQDGFLKGTLDELAIKSISLMLNKGFYVMMSDFSLKALIAKWNKELLGQNPFVQIGKYADTCKLRFNPNVLKECDSSQLVALGQLSENGEAKVSAMPETIVFAEAAGLDLSREPYSLEILTVATELSNRPVKIENYMPSVSPFVFSTIKEYSGPIGQAILSYKTGGRLIVSSCHWISLTNINTSEDTVFACYKSNYGSGYAEKKKSKYEQLSNRDKEVKLQKYAQKYVQKSAPCKYSKNS
jgi:hypothetical protein